MTRIGWTLLLVFLVLGGGFVWLLTRGGPELPPPEDPKPIASADGALVIPVQGIPASVLQNTGGDSRGGGARRHNAIDIMAPRGTPVIAAAAGTVEKLFDSANGGRTVYVRVGSGTVHYYAHLDGYRAGLAAGQRVAAGERLGDVGSTGSASEEAPHLHFEIKRMAPGERWWQGREVNPYPLLAGQPTER